MDLKYHYVILGSEWDLYKISYSDLLNIPDVDYIGGLQQIFGEKLGKILNSIAIRTNIIPLGFFLKRYFTKHLKNVEKPICFVFFANWVLYDISYDIVRDIKKKYPNSKVIWFFQDLIKSRKRVCDKIGSVKEKYDLLISFDYSDCKKYGMIYHPLLFSDISNKYNCQLENDIYFLGKAKDRLPEILKAYNILKIHNLKLDFNLVGVPKDQQKYQDEINYIDSMSYEDNLKHVAHSRCLLEVMQKSGTGFTSRVNEAICFGKKIITNNTMIKEAPFYNPKYISIFDERFAFDESFLLRISKEEVVDYHYKEELSPVNFLNFLDKSL